MEIIRLELLIAKLLSVREEITIKELLVYMKQIENFVVANEEDLYLLQTSKDIEYIWDIIHAYSDYFAPICEVPISHHGRHLVGIRANKSKEELDKFIQDRISQKLSSVLDMIQI